MTLAPIRGIRFVAGVLAMLAFAPLAAEAPEYGVIETEKGPIMVGETPREGLVAQFPAWADTAVLYRPAAGAVAKLHAVVQPVDILCVLGTWCSDSRREVARFWQVLDKAANPNLRLRMLSVGRKDDAAAQAKLAELGFAEDIRAAYGITLVPTFIFTLAETGLELGRIIETPQQTLEEDAATILADLVDPAAMGQDLQEGDAGGPGQPSPVFR